MNTFDIQLSNAVHHDRFCRQLNTPDKAQDNCEIKSSLGFTLANFGKSLTAITRKVKVQNQDGSSASPAHIR